MSVCWTCKMSSESPPRVKQPVDACVKVPNVPDPVSKDTSPKYLLSKKHCHVNPSLPFLDSVYRNKSRCKFSWESMCTWTEHIRFTTIQVEQFVFLADFNSRSSIFNYLNLSFCNAVQYIGLCLFVFVCIAKIFQITWTCTVIKRGDSSIDRQLLY